MTSRPAVNPLDLSLRPAQARDETFLRAVHDAGRAWDLQVLRNQLDDHAWDALLKQQYDAQHADYFDRRALARYAVVEWCQTGIGRIYADFSDEEIRLVDLIILPEYRGRGIASIIVRGLCGEAAKRRVPLRLHVHPLNPVRRLYARLGFREIGGQTGGFREMEWRSPALEGVALN